MFALTVRTVLMLALLAGGWRVAAAADQERPAAASPGPGPAPSQPGEVRIVRLRGASASELTERLKQLVPNLVVEPERHSNSLLLRGPREALLAAEAVVGHVEEMVLDPAQAAAYRVAICLLETSPPEASADWSQLDADGLMNGRVAFGELRSRRDFQLTVMGDHPARLQAGGEVAAAPESTRNSRSDEAQTTCEMRRVGTEMEVTARPLPAGEVLVNYQLRSTRLVPATAERVPASLDEMHADSIVRLTPGRALIAGGFHTETHTGGEVSRTCTLILLRVRPVHESQQP